MQRLTCCMKYFINDHKCRICLNSLWPSTFCIQFKLLQSLSLSSVEKIRHHVNIDVDLCLSHLLNFGYLTKITTIRSSKTNKEEKLPLHWKLEQKLIELDCGVGRKRNNSLLGTGVNTLLFGYQMYKWHVCRIQLPITLTLCMC